MLPGLGERATKLQQEALGQTFSGQAGGHPTALTPMIGEILGVQSAAITYVADGKQRSLRTPGIAEADIEAMVGVDGGNVTISNFPFTPVPGCPATDAKSMHVKYADLGLALEVSGKNGNYSPFAYQA